MAYHVLQARTTIKRLRPDANNRVGNVNSGQTTAVLKCIVGDGGNRVGDGDAGQAHAPTECILTDFDNRAGNINTGQTTAFEKRTGAYVSDRIWDSVMCFNPLPAKA